MPKAAFAFCLITCAALGQVALPIFSPSGGVIFSNQTVATCTTSNALIHYTVNGQDPTESDPGVVSGGLISVTDGFTNKLRAYRAGLTPSAVASAIFSLKVGPLTFNPPQSSIPDNTEITITTDTQGASIRYTFNGTTPDSNALLYTGPVIVSGNTNLTARAFRPGFADSDVHQQLYIRARVATVSFSPPAGVVTNGTVVTLSCVTTGVVIRYVLDGGAVTTNSPVYSGPLIITNMVTVRARGFRNDLTDSSLSQALYRLSIFESTVVTTWAGSPTAGLSNAVGAQARFYYPQGMCMDGASNIYVTDAGNSVIRKITPSRAVTTFAGTGVEGSQDGMTTNAQFAWPSGICMDTVGNLYVADRQNCHRIRKIDTNGMVTTLASLQECYRGLNLWQVEVDPAGTVYAGSYGTIIKVAPDGSFSYLAGGAGGCSGWQLDLVGVGIDSATNIYATTQGRIWKVAPDGSAERYAGSDSPCFGYGFSDGPRLLALFEAPKDSFVDTASNVFVSDWTRVRKVRNDGQVTTLAGTGVVGYKNGPGHQAQFSDTAALCADGFGDIYVADYGNHCIRKIWLDTDRDLIPDTLEGGATPFVVGVDDGAVDSDHDGMSNTAEFYAGTDPHGANSFLAIASISITTNHQIQISWPSIAEKTYVVKYSDDLSNWNILGSTITGDGSVLTAIDSSPVSLHSRRVFRVFVEPF